MGHVGLPTALGLAELGWDVTGADSDGNKIALLKAGQCTFYEPGLQEVLLKHIASPRFKLTDDVEAAIRSGSILFICVGTPQRENGEADLTQLEAISRIVARNLNGYKLIVEKSTVPAVTCQRIKKTIMRYANAGNWNDRNGDNTHLSESTAVAGTFEVASNPEFLQEGKALENFFHPDRVVCGVESERAREILKKLYEPLQCPIVVTDVSTAELIKHAANAFLATKISFINMVADLCEAVGADVTQVARGIGSDPRIGSAFLNAGIGFGGYCLPKDLRALIHLAEEHRVNCSLLKEVDLINRNRIDRFLKKVRHVLWVHHGKTIGILGLAFKPETDDIREAPSLQIIEGLLKEGAVLRLYDPQAMPNVRRVFPEEADRLSYCPSPYEAARGAHALLLLTEWDEFRHLDLLRVCDLMEIPVLVDGRNFYDPEELRKAGFEYVCTGRAKSANEGGL
jgi:UDPglucose 6-dehydrogenase